MSPDVILEFAYIIAAERHGLLAMGHSFGTLADGGAWETFYVMLCPYEGGQFVRLELFEPEELDAVRARFEALRPNPLRIPPNAATRALERWAACFAARDWTALAAEYAPTLVLEDRRPLIRMTGDRETVLASSREIASMGGRPSRTLLATAGDQLALCRIRFVGGEAGSEWEVDTLHLVEVDAEGRTVAVVAFDPTDRRAAGLEMLERFARKDEARDVPAAFFEGVRAYNAHDLDRVRAAMPDGFVVNDRRRTGVGRLERADDHAAFAGALFALAPDATLELLYTLAVEPHGVLAMGHGFGSLAEGGEWEGAFLLLAHCRGAQVFGLEIFEPEDLEAARARFAELRTTDAARRTTAASC
jgi:hypothetical protein